MTGALRRFAFCLRRLPAPKREQLTRPSWRPVPPAPAFLLN